MAFIITILNYDFMRIIILHLVFIFFTTTLSAQTVIQKQKTDKQYHAKSIKMPNTKNNNLIKVKEDSISTSEHTNEIKQKQIISKQNTKSAKVKTISPTTVVPNTTQRKDVKPSKSKYQRKKIKTKEVKDE